MFVSSVCSYVESIAIRGIGAVEAVEALLQLIEARARGLQ